MITKKTEQEIIARINNYLQDSHADYSPHLTYEFKPNKSIAFFICFKNKKPFLKCNGVPEADQMPLKDINRVFFQKTKLKQKGIRQFIHNELKGTPFANPRHGVFFS